MSYCQEKINLQNTFVKYLIPIKICVPLIFAHLACMKIKAIGGVQVQKSMSSLFRRTHWCGFNAFYRMSKFNSVPKIWPIQFLGFWLLYRKKKGHFWWFFHYFCLQKLQYWCWKHKNCLRDADYGYNCRKMSWSWKFWKYWRKLDKFRQKMPFYTKKRFIQNYILRYNLS